MLINNNTTRPTSLVKNRKKSIQNSFLDIKNDGSCRCPKCGSTNLRFSPGSGIHALRADCNEPTCNGFRWVDKIKAEKLLEKGGDK